MVIRDISCCFSGHRPNRLPWGSNENDPRCLELKFSLSRQLELLYGRGFRHFICGMAQGCDLYFAEAVLALRASSIAWRFLLFFRRFSILALLINNDNYY